MINIGDKVFVNVYWEWIDGVVVAKKPTAFLGVFKFLVRYRIKAGDKEIFDNILVPERKLILSTAEVGLPAAISRDEIKEMLDLGTMISHYINQDRLSAVAKEWSRLGYKLNKLLCRMLEK